MVVQFLDCRQLARNRSKLAWVYIAYVKPIIGIVLLCGAITAAAQIRIEVPNAAYKSRDRIDVDIVNTGASDVTYCVEYGYISFLDSDHSESTPTPAYVQQRNARHWSTLLIGPDIGSTRHPEILHSGESQHFPFRVNAHGTVRVVLEYRLGAYENFCANRKGMRVAKSREFPIE